MKLLLSILFLFVYPLSSQSQGYDQGDILIEYPINLNLGQFDWSAFSNKANVKKYIDFRNEGFDKLGAHSFMIGDINLDKKQLNQLEQELAFYKQGIKEGLSFGEIQVAEEAIGLHLGGIKSIEDQIRIQAGLGALVDTTGSVQTWPIIGNVAAYREGVWELYKADHDVIFKLIEKQDKNLYKLLGENDEAYAKFISPFVERIMGKTGDISQIYLKAWQSDPSSFPSPPFRVDNNMSSLTEMYADSLEVYNCFTKNFKNSEEGVHQQALGSAIQEWHKEQSLFGADIFINAYKNYGFNPNVTILNLNEFGEAPEEVKEKIGAFLREDFLYNDDFIKTEDTELIEARVRSLIGLKLLDLLNEEEEKIFNKALEKRIIINPNPNPRSLYGNDRPLP